MSSPTSSFRTRGPSACSRLIRTEAPGLPFAMITADPVLPPTADALEAADGFITKPLRPSALIGLATGLIENSRSSREQADG